MHIIVYLQLSTFYSSGYIDPADIETRRDAPMEVSSHTCRTKAGCTCRNW